MFLKTKGGIVPIIDPKNEGKSLKDKFMRLMQTKVFKNDDSQRSYK